MFHETTDSLLPARWGQEGSHAASPVTEAASPGSLPLSTKSARHLRRNHTGELRVNSAPRVGWEGRGRCQGRAGLCDPPPTMQRLERCAMVEMLLEIGIGSLGLWGQLLRGRNLRRRKCIRLLSPPGALMSNCETRTNRCLRRGGLVLPGCIVRSDAWSWL